MFAVLLIVKIIVLSSSDMLFTFSCADIKQRWQKWTSLFGVQHQLQQFTTNAQKRHSCCLG